MKGMVVSNEPGYYEDGNFGIRIENLLIVNEAATPHRFGGVSYFGFERLTFCPLQRKMLAMEVKVSLWRQRLGLYECDNPTHCILGY